MNPHTTLSILQYNVRKSKDVVMATLLRDPRTHRYDILAIQEPWRNPFIATTHHPAKDIFHLCYPAGGEGGHARVCFFINKRIDHKRWRFREYSRDICSLTLELSEEQQGKQRITIHNIYNPGRNSAGERTALVDARAALSEHQTNEQILLGDFNLHHPMWGGLETRHIDPEAEDLITIMEDFELSNTLPVGTVTYEERTSRSTIDLCLLTIGLVDRVIKSRVDQDLDHDSDHLPIGTILDLSIQPLEATLRRNWKRLDEKVYQKELRGALPPLRRPANKTALDRYVEDVVMAIKKAIEKAVPFTRPSDRVREGWTEECKVALTEAKRLKRLHSQHNSDDSWAAYCAARNYKARTIRKALRNAHRDRIEQASQTPEVLWRLANWARTRGDKPPVVTPAIKHPDTQQEITDPAKKADLFRDTFFPTPPEADLRDVHETEYNNQIDMPPITEQEIRDAIRAASPLKAPGPDGVTNKALQAGVNQLAAHLGRIFNQSLHLGCCPVHFHQSITVVLRKPDKDDYTAPKSYRPIALMNTIGKVMDAVIARRLSHLAETYHVLPATHMGGRKMRSTEHALHVVTNKIYEAWNHKISQVASLLLLDVSGAFDNVSHIRLLHNLRKRRVDEKTVKWVASFLSNRHTSIAIDGYCSAEYEINTGIPQGSPLSPILYLFYNADLIDACNHEADTISTGYIDDVAILAWGKTTEQTCETLSKTLEKARQWASTHASVFAPNKFQLVHFTRAHKRMDTKRTIQTQWGEIEPKATCKYLGLTMDSKLRWKEHVEEIRRKATKTVTALSCLGSSTWGVSLVDARRIYEGTALPQMMYACSIWSNASTKGKLYTQKTINTLQSIQARAARTICGAFKATSRAALDIEAFLLPIKQQIWKHNTEVVTRLLSCTDIASTAAFQANTAQSTTDKVFRKHVDPWQSIHNNMKSRQIQGFDTQEQIPCFITPPWRQGPKTHIDRTADKAQERHDKENAKNNFLSIYTDGSGIENEIGSAAVCPLTQQTRSVYMGPNTTSTVYAAELQGISLALQIAQEYADRNGERRNIAIYTDNQAAIWSVAKAEGRSGAYILAEIARQVQELQEIGRTVTVRWIPAHVGIPGNEAADKAAKESTGWRKDGRWRQPANAPLNLHSLRSTLKRWCKTQAEREWIADWKKETKGRATYRHTPRPTKKVLQLHKGLTKRESALLVQLRTEKIGLNDFLFNRNVPGISSSSCDCGERRQTVAHVLLRCKTHRNLRNRIFGSLSGRNNLRDILSKPQLATKAIKYMEQTQILGQVVIRDAQTTLSAGGRL